MLFGAVRLDQLGRSPEKAAEPFRIGDSISIPGALRRDNIAHASTRRHAAGRSRKFPYGRLRGVRAARALWHSPFNRQIRRCAPASRPDSANRHMS
jgi:hypothetical protein